MEFAKSRFAPWICVIIFIGILYFIFIEEENRLLFPNAIDFESLRGNTFPQDFKEALGREDIRQEISTIFEKSTDKLKRDLILSMAALKEGKVPDIPAAPEPKKEEVKALEPEDVDEALTQYGDCKIVIPSVEPIPTKDTYRTAKQKYESLRNWVDRNGESTMMFLHLHKAGGTEMRKLLIELLPKKSNYSCNAIESYSYSFQKFAQYGKLNKALAKLSDFIEANPSNFFLFTSIREPVARMISQYDFEQRWGAQYGEPEHPDQLWVQSPEEAINRYINNRGKVVDRYMGFNHYTRFFGCSSTGCTVNEEVFQNAVKVLNSMDLIFITEWYDDNRTVHTLRSVLEMPDLQIKHRSFRHFIRDRGKIKAVDPEIMKKMQCLNQYDVRLYQYAKQLAYKRLQPFVTGKKGDMLQTDINYEYLLKNDENWYITDPL